MADPEHLKILEKGVAVWNDWMRENPTIRPDFTDADLRRAELGGAILIGADLDRVNICQATLKLCKLRGGRPLHGRSP